MKLDVAIIGAAHGLKGEVKLDVRTDDPAARLAPGNTLLTDRPKPDTLTVVKTRQYKDATYAYFEGVTTRDTAEALRGVRLQIDTSSLPSEEDAWYSHELCGLEALDPEGYELGTVVGLEPMPAQDLLLVRIDSGEIVRVPFVHEIVTDVDVDDHCVVIDAPAGLFPRDDADDESESESQ
ncbi:MAG: ribosome maturation factor RimM [Actinomycetaceae bacterium]|nr:ribosome maturation factor RimM [Arcanobacterium sp.]MDD7505816.1 ribosome maturation factor RimM [Actinomycetaceae bacterium]MDY6142873.1 ribosome maturation factor RimM [Arcanobacterium sp.]